MRRIPEPTTARRAPYKREMHYHLNGREVSEREFWAYVRANCTSRGGEYRLVAELADDQAPGGYTPCGWVVTERGRRWLEHGGEGR